MFLLPNLKHLNDGKIKRVGFSPGNKEKRKIKILIKGEFSLIVNFPGSQNY